MTSLPFTMPTDRCNDGWKLPDFDVWGELTTTAQRLLRRIAKRRGKLTFVGWGYARVVFLLPGGHSVLKVARKNWRGKSQSERELECYRSKRFPMPACREIGPGIILARAVKPLPSAGPEAVIHWTDRDGFRAFHNIPEWAWKTDGSGSQLGYTKLTRKLVLFDAGCER